MGEGGLEEEDQEALDSLSATPSRHKAHSYSHNLRTNTGGNFKRHIHPRNHSLDDDSIITNTTATNTPANAYADTSDDEEFYPYATQSSSTGEQEDRRSSSSSSAIPPAGPAQTLPEFVANGGTGIFNSPVRAAVHPGRPPFLELRPHPLRETQVGKFLRTIGCTGTQIWAGQESGVRVWDLNEAYDPGIGMGGRARRGDEDAAPFYESGNTSPTLCLVVDCGSKLVWSGHKDGRIRSWRMDQDFHEPNTPIKEGLSWQAHRGPVISLLISSHGDLWSGSEGGVIRIWPWESIDKSLSLSPEERHMAALLVERSTLDLRSQVMVNGVCSISSSDVKCLLSDSVRGKVWAGGALSFSLWDARTRELLKVYNIDGQIENRVDMSLVQDQAVEEEINVKFVSKSKKEKSQGFLQRSRNAIMGAADAVRRVATKGAGAFVEDNKRTEAIVQTADGMIWTGCSNGLLLQWDGNGNRIQEFQHHPYAIQCFCTLGTRLWVGYMSGMVQVLDLEGNLVAGWVAHTGPVLKMVFGKDFMYSLAAHGGIRGWNISSPGPLDNYFRTDLAAKELTYTREENVRLLVGTWNVGQGRASHEALMAWLGSTIADVGIVVIGLQEVEMGAGFLAMSAAKETVGLEGSAIGQWWQDTIGKTLDEGSTFERVGSRQLAGLLIAIWVRKTLRPHVGDLDVAAVACGLGRAIGNKGGVGLRIRVYDRIMCFVNCHLAAHLEAVNRRNADFDHIFRTMVFTRSSNLLNTAAGMVPNLYLYFSLVICVYIFWLLYSSGFPFVLSIAAGVSSSAHMARDKVHAGTNSDEGSTHKKKNVEEGRPDLAEADFVLFLGDFNYRLFGISYDEARDFVSQRSFDWLREKDQLRAEMKAGKVFQGMHEALIRFPPTYKFERGKPGLGGYDSGEKKRIPAWCDRIIFRDNRVSSTSECSLECPVVSSVLQYEACMDVTESDHKPVRCKINIDIARIDRSVRREEFGEILRSNKKVDNLLKELCYVPETSVNTNTITLQNQDASILKITNRSGIDKATFHFTCEGQSVVKSDEQQSGYVPRGSFGFPRWLEVLPAGGVLGPDQTIEVSVRHEEYRSLDEPVDGVPQSWWNENTRDKEAILHVNILGSCSSESRTHKINIRHCYSVSATRTNSKTHGSKRFQTSGS